MTVRALRSIRALEAATAAAERAACASSQPTIPSEPPECPIKLAGQEKKLWNYVVTALSDAGMIHRTDGMTVAAIVKTFALWVRTLAELDAYAARNGGSYMTTMANGIECMHPAFKAARDLSKDLREWLPEAAMTIPMFRRIAGPGAAPGSGSLVEDPVEAHRKRRQQLFIEMQREMANASIIAD